VIFLSENLDYGDFSENNENFTKKLCFSDYYFCALFLKDLKNKKIKKCRWMIKKNL
jgi:hypothetical protein